MEHSVNDNVSRADQSDTPLLDTQGSKPGAPVEDSLTVGQANTTPRVRPRTLDGSKLGGEPSTAFATTRLVLNEARDATISSTTSPAAPPASPVAAIDATPLIAALPPVGTPDTSKAAHAAAATKRIGAITLTILIVCPLLIVASMAFLAFLWFSSRDNPTWRYIVVKDHLMTVVSGFGKVLETSLQFLVGTSCAMLASLLLEGFHVILRDVAAISATRTYGGSANLFMMLWKQIRGGGPPGTRNWYLILLCSLTTLVMLFSQTVTVILNTDIGLASLAGYQNTDSLAYGFRINETNIVVPASDYIEYHGSTWSKKPSVLPTFAEYSRPPVEQDGVSDTGVTLRAFLPYASQQIRQDLQSYSGRTTVIDTRVTCQVPDIQHVTVRAGDQLALIVEGGISATRKTPRLASDTFQWGPGDTSSTPPIIGSPIPISCIVPIGDVSKVAQKNRMVTSGWRSSLCQLPEGGTNATMFTGGLVSEFQDLAPLNMSDLWVSEASYNWGVAYLFLNVTEGSAYDWDAVVGAPANGSSGFAPPYYQERNEWRDYVFSNGNLILSTTLCYASFMTADLPVDITGSLNRFEPSMTFDFDSQTYIFPEVRAQMGQNASWSLSDRGILSLEPQRPSWLANSTDELPLLEPYIRDFANMKGPEQDGNDGNYSAVLLDKTTLTTETGALINPDPFFVAFFQDIVGNGGSVAFALQSMYTVMAGMAYYDQLAQFDAKGTVQRTSFVTVNAPVSWRGLLTVAIVVVLQVILITFLVVRFLAHCRYSMLGEIWPMIAQTTSPVTAELVGIAGSMTDEEVKGWLRRRSLANARVGLAVADGADEPGITDAAGSDGGRSTAKRHL